MKKTPLRAVALLALSLASCKTNSAAEGEATPEPWFVQDPNAAPVAVGEPPPIDPMAIPPVDDPIIVPADEPSAGTEPLVPDAPSDTPELALGTDPAPISPGAEGGPAAATRLVDVDIERGDSMKLYSDWSAQPENDLLPDGGLTRPKLKAGQRIQLVMSPDAFRKFTDNREKARLQKEREFLQTYEIESVKPHTIAKGDSVWKLSKDNGDVPSWLLKRMNRNVDFEHMKLGDVVLIPSLRKVVDEKGRSPGELVWDDTPGKGPVTPPTRVNQPVRRPEPDEPDVVVAPAELPQGLTIRVRPGETVKLLSSWSKVPSAVIRTANPQIGRTGLAFDQQIKVPVADAHITKFIELRKRFHGDVPKPPSGGTAEAGAVEQNLPIHSANTRIVTHRVKRGETVAKIAAGYQVTVKAIKAANPGTKLTNLKTGSSLRVPVPRRPRPR